MAERSVSVKLKLDVSDIDSSSLKAVASLEAIEKRAKEAGDELDRLNEKLGVAGRGMEGLTVKAVALDASLRETQARAKELNDELGKVGSPQLNTRVTSTRTGLDDLKTTVKNTTDETTKLSDKTEEASNRFTKMTGESSFLESALRSARDRVKELNTEFENTGDEKTLGKLRKARSEVRLLENDVKAASREAERLLSADGSNAGGGASKFATGLGSIFNVSPELAVGIAAAIVVGSPIIGAALDAALVLGVGLGGIVTGILGQLNSPLLKSAGQNFWDGITSTLTRDTSSFEIPLANALDKIGASVQTLLNGIDFKGLATEVGPLADGISGLIEALGPGLNDAIKASLPILNEFAQDLPVIGKSIADLLHEVSDSQGLRLGLLALLSLINGLLIVTAHLLGGLGNIFEGLVSAAGTVEHAISGVAGGLKEFFAHLSQFAENNIFAKIATFFSPIFGLSGKVFGIWSTLFGWIQRTTGAIGDFWDSLLGKGTDHFGHELDQATSSADGLQGAAKRLSGEALALGDNFKPLADLMGVFGDATKSGADVATAFGTAISAVGDQVVPATTALSEYAVISDAIGVSQQNAAQMAGEFGAVLDGIDHTAGSTQDHLATLAGVFNDIANSELSAADKAGLLSKAWDEMNKPAIDLNEATEAFNKNLLDIQGSYVKSTKGVTTYRGALDAHSRSLDINSEAGLKNRDAVEAGATSLHKLYLADIASGDSADVAAQKDAARREELIKTTKAAGLDESQTRALIDQYDAIPGGKNTDITISGFDKILADLTDSLVAQHMLTHPGETQNEARRTLPEWAGGSGRAEGGPIPGRGGPKEDNIPIWASAGEFMQQTAAVDYYGLDMMHAINQRTIPREVFRRGDPPIPKGWRGFADGGMVTDFLHRSAADPVWRQDWIFPVDVSHTKIPDPMAAFGPFVGTALQFLSAQNGKPYGWAEAGPGAYDCSGIVSAIWNILHGMNPYSHTFSTENEQPFFPIPGSGGILTAGWSNPFSNGIGHTAAVLAGVPFESTGSQGVHMGSGVTPLGAFQQVGHFDQGGWLKPGWNAMFNGTGATEKLVRPQFAPNYGNNVVRHEHRIVIEGNGLLRNLRAEISDQGGDVQLVLGSS